MIPMWSAKESDNYISEPLTYVLNLSINSGIVPAQMKLLVWFLYISLAIKVYFLIIDLYQSYQYFQNF